MAYFNATPESVIDRLKFPTLDETQKTVDPFHELSTLLFTPSASIQMIRKVSHNNLWFIDHMMDFISLF